MKEYELKYYLLLRKEGFIQIDNKDSIDLEGTVLEKKENITFVCIALSNVTRSL